MGASTQISSPAGKGSSNASTSGQPRMGQPNVQAPYRRTIGGWDQAQIATPTQGSGKSGKGSGIQPFQPRPFTYQSPTQATQPVNPVTGSPVFDGRGDFSANPNAGMSFSPNMNNLANGPLGVAIGSIANAFGGTQAPAPVSDLSFTPVGFSPSIDIGGYDGGGGYGSGNGPGGSGTGEGGYGPQ